MLFVCKFPNERHFSINWLRFITIVKWVWGFSMWIYVLDILQYSSSKIKWKIYLALSIQWVMRSISIESSRLLFLFYALNNRIFSQRHQINWVFNMKFCDRHGIKIHQRTVSTISLLLHFLKPE